MAGPPIKYHTEEERRVGRNLREVLRRKRNLEKSQTYQREWREKNKEKLALQHNEWYFEHIKERKLYSRNWVLDHRDRWRETKRNYQQKRLKEDKVYKFNCRIRSLIYQSFTRINLNKNKKN